MEVRSIAPSDSAQEAARRMGRWHVGFLVVVEDEKPVGVITDRDVALRTLRDRKDPATCTVSGIAVSDITVADMMTAPVITLKVGQAPSEASALMREHAIRKLPIVDSDGRLRGVFTADDLILSLGKRIYDLAHAVQRELRNEACPPDTGSSVFGKE